MFSIIVFQKELKFRCEVLKNAVDINQQFLLHFPQFPSGIG